MSSRSGGMSSMDKVRLADLHVFVVPLELWLEKYRTAFNNIALESVSAGFVRVPPDASLSTLRDHVEDQLGLEIVPENFVFLRSVGRCMAIVKNNQESLLKARDFLPPAAYSPEIFILPGTHASLARPIPEANNVVIATQGLTTAGLSSTQPISLPAVHGSNFQMALQDSFPNPYTNPYGSQPQPFNRRETSSEDEEGFGGSRQANLENRENSMEKEHFNYSEGSDSDGVYNAQSRSLSQARDENGESTDRYPMETQQNRNSKLKSHKKDSSDSNESHRPDVKTVKFIQPEVVLSVPAVGPGGVPVSPPTPIPSGRVIALPQAGDREANSEGQTAATTCKDKSPGKNQKHGSKSQKVASKKKRRSRSPSVDNEQSSNGSGGGKSIHGLENGGVASESQDRAGWEIPNIEDVEERSKFSQFPSPDQKLRKPLLHENEVDSGIAEDGSTPPYYEDDSGRPGYQAHDGHSFDHVGYDEGFAPGVQHKSGYEIGFGADGAPGQTEEEDPADIAGAGSDGADTTQLEKGAKNPRGNANKVADKTKGNAPKGKKPTSKKPAKKSDTLEDKFRIPKMSAPPPIKMPARGDKDLEKDSGSAKDRKAQEIEQLKAELRHAKQERVDVEKDREQKMRRAKNVQNQTLQKRNQAKNVWKKRFFDEKRKTAPLEEQVNRLRYDMQVQHKALLSYLESKDREGNKTQQDTDKTPSEKSNQRMQLARLQHDVEDLRQRVEDTKMKLASEMKMRDASQKELKEIRAQLLEKKISLSQLAKHDKGFSINPENVTA